MTSDQRPVAGLVGDTRLRPAPEVLLRFESDGGTTLVTGSHRVPAGRHAALVLDVFRTGRSLQDGLDRLAAVVSDRAAWMRVATVVRAAVDAGILVPEPRSGEPVPESRSDHNRSVAQPIGFAAAGIHIAMLDDVERTRAFCDAIARTVRPGDVVVDIGTGSGVLAVAAARAGARRVYAVEASDIGSVAEKVFAANGVGDVVELVRGWSTEIELPERADVLVSEILGDDPLGERLLEVYADAAARHLVPGARVIPRSVDLMAWPLEVPPAKRDRRFVSAGHVERWRDAFGIELGALADANGASPRFAKLPASETGSWRRLGAAATVATLALPPTDGTIDITAELPLSADGDLGAVVVGFRADLAEGVELVVGPGTPGTHWASATYLLPETVSVSAGDRGQVRLSHTIGSQLDVTVEPGSRRHRLAGLVVAGAVPLRDLESLGADDDASADVVVRRGTITAPDPPHAAGPRAGLGPRDVVLRADRGTVHVHGGAEITVEGDADDDEVQLTVLGASLTALCLQRGLLPLHASTVVGPHGAVALCGDRGAGKTTLSAWLDRQGFALLADDLAPVRVHGDHIIALGAVRRFKFREDTLAAFGLDPACHAPLRMDGEVKYPVPAWSPPPPDGVPLHAVVIVEPADEPGPPTVTRLYGAEAAVAVQRLWFRPRWAVEPTVRALVGRLTMDVAARVPVLRLRRSPDPADLLETLAAVRQNVLGPPADHGDPKVPRPSVSR